MNFEYPNFHDFQTEINGKKVELFALKCGNLKVFVTNYGARIVGIFVPDKFGKPTDVIVGPNTIKDFLQSKEKFYGAIVGRCCNRIRNAEFNLENQLYKLSQNKGKHHLHGGDSGFHEQVWKVESYTENQLVLSYFSNHLEEGYPGNLQTKISYSVSDNETLEIKIEAISDQATVVNMTSHPFFNLNGFGTILNHQLWINTNCYTVVDEEVITTGEVVGLEKSPLDFRVIKSIGKDIDSQDQQIQFGKGFDHNFVLNKDSSHSLAAIAKGDLSGIVLEIWTDEKGLQLYTGNWMNGENKLKNGQYDTERTAFCLETQNFPNAINFPHFPNSILQPDDRYMTKTVFQFSVEENS